MALPRLARILLALTLAYALVLSGVAVPALGHGLGAADELCAAPAGPAPDPASAHPHDCCPALCGAGVAILPSRLGLPQAGSFADLLAPTPFAARHDGVNRGWKSARAPPAG